MEGPPASPPAEAEPAASEVPGPIPAPPPLPEVAIEPRWETVPRPDEGFAGLAVWPGSGQRPWVIVAAAVSHRLVLFDAATGELLRELGSLGERPGQFRQPVDVAVAGDLAFVAERGGGRVQVLRLPGLATVGFLGEGELERPTAVAVAVDAAGEGWVVWVAEEGVRGADAMVEADAVAEADGSTKGEGGGSQSGVGATVGGGPAAEAGGGGPAFSAVILHRFEVTAEGRQVASRRFAVPLAEVPAARLAALAIAPAGGALVALATSPAEPPASDRAGGVTVAPALADGAAGLPGDQAPAAPSAPAAAPSIAPLQALADLPLTVATGAVAGATHLRCGDGRWIGLLSLEGGSLLALDPAASVAATRLTLPEASSAAALATLPRPLPELPAGALYAVTAAGTLLAIDVAALAAACP